jgi:hypothetical protein
MSKQTMTSEELRGELNAILYNAGVPLSKRYYATIDELMEYARIYAPNTYSEVKAHWTITN